MAPTFASFIFHRPWFEPCTAFCRLPSLARSGLFSLCPGWPETHCVTQAGLHLKVLLSLLLECWNYRWVQHPAGVANQKTNVDVWYHSFLRTAIPNTDLISESTCATFQWEGGNKIQKKDTPWVIPIDSLCGRSGFIFRSICLAIPIRRLKGRTGFVHIHRSCRQKAFSCGN